MIERWRTRRTLGLLLALIGLAATGATYASLGPSVSSPQVYAGSGETVMGVGQTGGSSSSVAGASSVKAGTHRQLRVKVGRVTGLYPGAVKRLPVKVYNPNSERVRIERLYVHTFGIRGCRWGRFDPARKTLHLHRLVGPHQSTLFKLRYGMRTSAPDGCQGAQVRIRVRVKAWHR